MTRQIRYSLLVVGFIFFIIAAPLIVLYVRGIAYDFADKKFVSTGILAIRTNPKNSEILINGKIARKNSGDVKFLLPAEYQLTVKKTGYQTWNKRLKVNEGEVTWANPQDSYIYLLLDPPLQKATATSVSDFYSGPSGLSFLTATGFNFSQKNYTLPKPVNKILAQDTGGKNFILYQNSSSSPATLLWFNSLSGKFTDLSATFSPDSIFKFSDNGDLFALDGGSLYQLKPGSVTKQTILKSVKGFYFLGNSLYYIREENNIFSLYLSDLPYTQPQLLLNNLTPFSGNAQLFVTYGKQIFMVANNVLYQANGVMQPIADTVTSFNFDPSNSLLSVFHLGEFDYFDSYGQNLNFVTRSGQTLSNLDVRTNIDYAFYLKGNQVIAIELDTRDSQNQYVLYNGEAVQKFTIDDSGKNMVILDNGQLITLVIR